MGERPTLVQQVLGENSEIDWELSELFIDEEHIGLNGVMEIRERFKLPDCIDYLMKTIWLNKPWLLADASQQHWIGYDDLQNKMLDMARKKDCFFKGLEIVALYKIQPRHELEHVGLASLFS